MSSTFFDTEKKGYAGFLKAKIMRLIVPLIGASLFLLVPRLYMSQEYEAWTRIDGDKITTNYFVYMWNVIP